MCHSVQTAHTGAGSAEQNGACPDLTESPRGSIESPNRDSHPLKMRLIRWSSRLRTTLTRIMVVMGK